jgi:hypothetical protein
MAKPSYRPMDASHIRAAIPKSTQFDVIPLSGLYHQLADEESWDTIEYFQARAMLPGERVVLQYSDRMGPGAEFAPGGNPLPKSHTLYRTMTAGVVEYHPTKSEVTLAHIIFCDQNPGWSLANMSRVSIDPLTRVLPADLDAWKMAPKPPEYHAVPDALYRQMHEASIAEFMFILGGLSIPNAFHSALGKAPRVDRRTAVRLGIPKTDADAVHTTVVIGRHSGRVYDASSPETGGKRRLHWVRGHQRWIASKQDYTTIPDHWRGDLRLGISTANYRVAKGPLAVSQEVTQRAQEGPPSSPGSMGAPHV